MEGIISAVAIGLALCIFFAMSVWCVWAIFKAMHDYLANNHGNQPQGDDHPNELPYKVEPEKPADDVAIPDTSPQPEHEPGYHLTTDSDNAIQWTFTNAPEPKPKRKYTKRSKYWTDKRKKAAAAKARKAKRKSK